MRIVFYCCEESSSNIDTYFTLGCCGTVSSMILASFGLAQLGHDVTVLNGSPTGIYKNVNYYHTQSTNDVLNHLEKNDSYDVFIANGWAVNIFALLTASSMIRVHWIHNFIDRTTFESLFSQRRVHYGICVSENQLGTWWRSAAFPWMTKIPNSVDLSCNGRPRPNHEKEEKIMFIGATRESKGFHDALRIFLRFRATHTQFKFYVAGDANLHATASNLSLNGIFEQEYENRCLKHLLYSEDGTLRKGIVLLGRISRSEVFSHLATTKVALLNPSWTSEPETFSISALDAQCMGVPVVSTYRGGIPEVVENGKSGLLTRRKADQHLVNAICRIVEDENLAARLSTSAIDIARSRFGVDAIAPQWEKKLLKMKDHQRFSGNLFRAICVKIRYKLSV